MNDRVPPREPMLVHGCHIFYRGESYFMARTVRESMPMVDEFIWENDCFYTDSDPLYFFADFRVIYEFRAADQVRYRDEMGRQHERRTVLMLDHKEEFLKTVTFLRDLDL